MQSIKCRIEPNIGQPRVFLPICDGHLAVTGSVIFREQPQNMCPRAPVRQDTGKDRVKILTYPSAKQIIRIDLLDLLESIEIIAVSRRRGE